MLEVLDDGAGIDPELLSRVFDPFFSTKARGHGLGLATVLGAARSHHGFVRVDSPPGDGAHFQLGLPAATDGIEEPTDPSSPPQHAPSAREGLVLLVDDEHAILRSTGRALAQAGYEVLAAEDGLIGLRRFHAHRDDVALALLDVRMPGMRGEDLARALRSLEPELPIIFSTAYKDIDLDDLPHACLLPKPYSISRLIEAIDEALAPRGEGT